MPENKRRWHFIGIGGIGMSGIAQMASGRGYIVSGSDRGYGRSENNVIFRPLEKCGIRIYPQDGSFAAQGGADVVVYSSAIEQDNPDLKAAENLGNAVLMHRSTALAELVSELNVHQTIAVTGSCGKSSVTAYLAEALQSAGRKNTGCLNGGLCNAFRSPDCAGNYYSPTGGAAECFVFEADESDKSLVNYTPDAALIMNIGTDHYDKKELARVFGEFLGRVKHKAVLEKSVFDAVREFLPEHLEIHTFGEKGSGADFELHDYFREGESFYAVFSDGTRVALPKHGRYNAVNALCIYAFMRSEGMESGVAAAALSCFQGVWRRNDFAGKTPRGAMIFDDYSHNPEKIASALSGAAEVASKRIFAVFQPHGYGPFGFMREELFNVLEKTLRRDDRFIFLEPYYAGGTSSFKPGAAEVCADYSVRSGASGRYLCIPDRKELKKYLLAAAEEGDVIMIMGARDNSLSEYAAGLAKNTGE